MGTEAQKEHRAHAVDVDNQITRALGRGKIHTKAQFQDFLESIGQKRNGPWFQRYWGDNGEGFYSVYGPSADVGKEYDFDQNIFRYNYTNDAGEPKYHWDPKSAANTIPGGERQQIDEFYAWRASPEAQPLINEFGGNAIAAWYAGRARSGRPNTGTMNWFTNDMNFKGLGGIGGMATSPVPTAPVAATTASQYTPPGLDVNAPGWQGLLNQMFMNREGGFRTVSGDPQAVQLGKGGLAWGYIDPSWMQQTAPTAPKSLADVLTPMIAKKKKTLGNVLGPLPPGPNPYANVGQTPNNPYTARERVPHAY